MSKISMKSLVLAIIASCLAMNHVDATEKYRVVRGDNLSKIGRIYGIHYREIMAANRLKNTVIYPNQVLIIPLPKAQPIAKTTTTPAIASPKPVAIARPVQPPPSFAGNFSTAPSKPISLPPLPPLAQVTEEEPISPYLPPIAINDPVKPYVAARKLVNQAPPVTTRSISRPVPTAVPHRVPLPNVASQSRYTRPVRGREVAAAATYPKSPSMPEAKKSISIDLEPENFPKPSFKSACKAHPKCGSTTKKRSTSSRTRSYTVCRGDSVWTISRKFGVSPLKLRKVNNIMLSKIRPGMKLTIPESHVLWSL